MTSETLEIRAQDDGSIVVTRLHDDSAEPLFTFQIADSSSRFSDDLKMQIAQAMAAAGMKKIAEMEYSAFATLDEDEETTSTWH